MSLFTVRTVEEDGYGDWDLPAAQQPQWRHHPAFGRTIRTLQESEPLVQPPELAALRGALAEVASGSARALQAGDCAESFYECSPWHTHAKIDVLDRLGQAFEAQTGQPVVRIGRIGGQFAKPRSQDIEQHAGLAIPVFRGHLINSEVPNIADRQPDPRRMLWALQASAKVVERIRQHRELREHRGASPGESGPWSSHEALVVDYETALVRTDPATGEEFLSSTHLPWIGERTRQLGSAHVRLLSSVSNPVASKVGPSVTVAELLGLCASLDPDREPGRLVLISRLGRDRIAALLPGFAAAVRNAGHPVVWLCDPMHGNTILTDAGVKTRYLAHLVDEVRTFHHVLERVGIHPGGLHLEVASDDVTECVGGEVDSPERLGERATTLCDPRLNPDQAKALIAAAFS